VTPCWRNGAAAFVAAALWLPSPRVAVKELDQADMKREETFDELKTIDVFCLKPHPVKIVP
jgi:hypothetical protein